MTDFQVRSDNVDVEQIMRQIRARIREKRGVDYTEEEIKELARVKLEKFLDPTGVRSDLLAQFRRTKAEMPAAPNYTFEDSTLFESHRGFLRFMRRILNPMLKLFFNPNPLIHALHIQSELNTRNAKREELDSLHYEVIHNLVLETTRLGIQVKNLKMQVESMSSRLDFDERRARALEGVVQYRPGAVAPLQPPQGGSREPREDAQAQERRTRRRRRRGKKPGSGREENGTSASGRDESDAGSGERSDTRRERPGPRYREAGPDAQRERPAPRPSEASSDAAERGHQENPKSDRGESAGQNGSARPQEAHPQEARQSGEGGFSAPKPSEVQHGEGSPAPKPQEARGGEGGPVPPKPQQAPGGEGG